VRINPLAAERGARPPKKNQYFAVFSINKKIIKNYEINENKMPECQNFHKNKLYIMTFFIVSKIKN